MIIDAFLFLEDCGGRLNTAGNGERDDHHHPV